MWNYRYILINKITNWWQVFNLSEVEDTRNLVKCRNVCRFSEVTIFFLASDGAGVRRVVEPITAGHMVVRLYFNS